MYISITEKLMILFNVHGHLLSLFVYYNEVEILIFREKFQIGTYFRKDIFGRG
jgi:hypothetical protein